MLNEVSQCAGVQYSTLTKRQMDGIEELNGVTVLAATNKPQVIVGVSPCQNFFNKTPKDPALMRPGRLDRIMWVLLLTDGNC